MCASVRWFWHENSENGMYFVKKDSWMWGNSFLLEILGMPRSWIFNNIFLSFCNSNVGQNYIYILGFGLKSCEDSEIFGHNKNSRRAHPHMTQ